MAGSGRAHRALQKNMKEIGMKADHKIQPMPEVGTNGRTLFIQATLDGFVTLRTPGGDTKLDPKTAEQASRDFAYAARLARHVTKLTASAPAGLDEQQLIAWLQAAFAITPFPEETKPHA